MDPESIMPILSSYLRYYGPKILGAAFIFFLGRWTAKYLRRFMDKYLRRTPLNPGIRTLLINLSYFAILILVVYGALNQLGIQPASLVRYVASFRGFSISSAGDDF